MKLSCQKNVTDGRVLVTDGRALPDDARYKVISFRETSRDGIWAHGPCEIELR